MATVALIVHEMRDDAETQARALARWLADRGDKLAILDSNVDELADAEIETSRPETGADPG